MVVASRRAVNWKGWPGLEWDGIQTIWAQGWQGCRRPSWEREEAVNWSWSQLNEDCCFAFRNNDVFD